MRYAGLLMLLVGVAACRESSRESGKAQAPPAQVEAPVVYGTDNRTEVYDYSNYALYYLAYQSTVALMRPGHINVSPQGNVTFNAQTLGAVYNLCSSERFTNQLAPAFCTGTLIDDDLVLTAGRCLTSAADCASTRFVFEFLSSIYSSQPYVTAADVFSCQSIVARAQGVVDGRNLDFAIARLDRPATPRFVPAPVRADTRPMAIGRSVGVISASSGTPFKIDAAGKVLEPRATTLDYFVAATDSFQGSSGAAVYELDGNTVAGILVRGEKDYVTQGSCRVARVCGETGCRGEDVTYVRPAIEAYCQVATSARLCPPAQLPQPASAYAFSASSTHTAQQNTVNQQVTFAAGDRVTVGTCGLTKAFATGDTALRVFGPDGAQVAFSDDACGGRGSQVTFVAQAGTYEIRAGCHGEEACKGAVAWTATQARPYTASYTWDATSSTVNWNVALTEGQTISVGTCSVEGANGDGYNRVRLSGPSGSEVGSGLYCGAYTYGTTYTVPAGGAGTYQIRAGCYYYYTCSGTVAWRIE